MVLILRECRRPERQSRMGRAEGETRRMLSPIRKGLAPPPEQHLSTARKAREMGWTKRKRSFSARDTVRGQELLSGDKVSPHAHQIDHDL